MKSTRNISLLFLTILISFAASAKDASKVLNVASKGDQLFFDKTSLSAKPNQPLKITYKNTSSKTSGMQHNFIVAKPGTEDAIAAASIAAGADKGWLADSPDIIAHTKLLNAGESETLTFNAPSAPGDYPYFCSFPGHNATMKGVLHVK